MKYDVLMVIKTIGLAYDDRLKKESNSLNEIGKKVKIIVLEDTNLRKKSTIYDNIPYISIPSISRRIFKQKTKLSIKLLEMNIRFIFQILFNRSKVVWVHNFESLFLVLVLKFLKSMRFIHKIVWDQHELVTASDIPNGKLFSAYKKANHHADCIIQANLERKQYFENDYSIDKSKVFVIENFVDNEFYEYKSEKLPEEVTNWLSGSNYYLAQGGASKSRNIVQLIEAMIACNKRMIVVGPIQESLDYIENKYPNYKEFIYFTGMIPQMEIVKYIDHAKASIILYSNVGGLNLELCAANRLYQAISRGIPIIVGSNPTMKNIVEREGNGVTIANYGNNKQDIIDAIHAFEIKEQDYQKNAIMIKQKFAWEMNLDSINKIIEV